MEVNPALCSDVEADQRLVLQAVYDAWVASDFRWPHAHWIDNILDHEHDLDLQKTLPTIPDRYLVYNHYAPSDSELKLTVAGIACCKDTASDVALFLRVLRWLVDRERAFRPTNPSKEEALQVSSAEAEDEWTQSGAEVSPQVLAKAFALVDVEALHSGWQRPTSEFADWSVTVTRKVRPFRTVRTLEDYLAIKEGLDRERVAQIPRMTAQAEAVRSVISQSTPLFTAAFEALAPTYSAPVANDEATDVDEGERGIGLGLDDLHSRVADACHRRFAGGHYRDGVLAAIQAFRDLVRERSGLTDEDDSTLMGRAFGGVSPALVVADVSTESGRNQQRGMAHLSQGVLAYVRNPLTHSSREIEPAEALRMVALVDMLVRSVEERPGPPSSFSAEA